MFDISFWELILVCIVALLVLGPDKLPGAIRTVGLWVGRLKRSFNNIKADIEREVGADEIRRQLRNEAIMEKIKNTRTQITETVDSVRKEAESVRDDLNIERQISDFKNEVESGLSGKDGQDGEKTPENSATESVAAPGDPEPQAAPSAPAVDSAPPPSPQPKEKTETTDPEKPKEQ